MLKLPSASVNPDNHSKKLGSRFKSLFGGVCIVLTLRFCNWYFLTLQILNLIHLVGTIVNNPCNPVEAKNNVP